MPAEYVSNHLASRCYLEGFTDPTGYLMVRGRYGGKPRRAKPSKVGFRNNWWGSDEGLRAFAEQRLSTIEEEAANVLRAIPRGGLPYAASEDRVRLLQFIALHLVRTNDWRELVFTIRERQLHAQGHDRRGYESIAKWVRSDGFWVDALLRQIPHIAGFLGSAHWDLIRFEQPWLLTSDQPVAQFPFLAEGARALATDPRPSLVHTVEFRFAIDPSHAVVLSWLDRPEADEVTVADRAMAVDMNLSVGARTDQEIFWKPDIDPPLVHPPWLPACAPIATRLHEGYGTATAMRSERRRRAIDLLVEGINADRIDEVRSVRLDRIREARPGTPTS